MKHVLVMIVTAVVAAAVVSLTTGLLTAGATPAQAVQRSSFVPLPPAAPVGQMVLYGHIKALTRKGSRYLLRFDPAWFTSGVTANVAAAEDGAVPKGQPVPNDNYVVDESHRRLTYLVPTTARITVLTNEGTTGITSTRIPVAELAQIVKGKNPKGRKLFESLDSGVWIRVRIDTVKSLDQQYRP